MKFKILKSYKGLTPFNTPDLPELVLLTGKNGSGKSQLLQLIYNTLKKSPLPIKNTIQIEGLPPIRAQLITFGGMRVSEIQMSTDALILSIKPLMEALSSFKKGIGTTNTNTLMEICNHFRIKPLQLNTEHIRKYILSENNNINFLDNRIVRVVTGYFSIKKDNAERKVMAEYEENLEYLTPEEFKKQYPNPLNLINEALNQAKLGYQLKKIDYQEYLKGTHYRPVFTTNRNQQEIPMQDLSTGEKVLCWIAVSIFNIEGKYAARNFPNLLLLDEIDAGLHPSMIKNLIALIQNYFVPKGIKTILTTHSPTTVALAPEDSIYVIKKEQGATSIEKTNKTEAIRSLLDGVRSIDILPKNIKYVFTEAENDKYFYSQIYNKFLINKFPSEVHIEFIASGGKSEKTSNNVSGGKERVEYLVKKMRDSGNLKIFGIIDWDSKNSNQDGIFVHSKNEMYSLENVIMSPYFLGLLLLQNSIIEVSDVITSETRIWTDTFNQNFKVEHLNALSEYVEKKIIGTERGELKDVELVNGKMIQLGSKYCHFKGHELENLIKEKFKKLNSFNNDGSLIKGIIDRVIKIYPEFLPKSSLDILKNIQDSDSNFNEKS